MASHQRSLYPKYRVTKLSGPTDPDAHYFVLRLDTDPHARVALAAYAESVREIYSQLADDIIAELERLDAIGLGTDYPWDPAIIAAMGPKAEGGNDL